ncbi:esterase-like activity of phytase family protein [Sphingomonas sp. 1P06PA]|uniref:esterase-like activity of phytase family protein n=1 Tax=Sphingomonas sp. 1P06PA TaxID=554121 RepID=UPI0039A72A77
MRHLAILLLLAVFLALGGAMRVHRFDPAPIIHARPVPLDRDRPDLRQVGRLTFVAGWSLSSREADMGGISSMSIVGRRVTTLSDRGTVIAFDVPTGGLAGDARLSPLPETPGDRTYKGGRDSESMTIDRATGRLWVGFEGANAIWRYGAGLATSEGGTAPPQMADWSSNSGPEAIVRLPDGRFLVFAEGKRGPRGGREALLFAGDPSRKGMRAIRFEYRPPEGYRPTEAALLPDGQVLLLNRRASLRDGVSAVIERIDPARIRPGQIVPAERIARIAPPLIVDNLEAMAVTRERGRTMLWIASDDNFLFFQRTLLLKFALD